MRKSFYIILGLALLMVLSSCAKRSTQWTEDEALELIRQVPVIGNPVDLSFDHEYIYVAADQGGLSIIKKSDGSVRWFTSIPEATGGAKTLYRTRKVSAVRTQDHLFINETDGADTIYIIDISQPDSLKLIGGITGATQDILDMRVWELDPPVASFTMEMAFTAGRNFQHGYYDGNLWVGFDFSFTPPATASGYDMNDTHIFIAAQQRGILIYTRETQAFVGEVAVSGEAQKVRLHGNYAIVSGRQGGVTVIDISNPASPQVIANWSTVGYATTVDISGNRAVVSSNSGGVYLFDITVPASPVLIQRLTSAGYTNNAKFDGNNIVVASRDQGVLTYRIK